LRRICGSSDLSTVTKLNIVVDSTKNSSLEVLGSHLPSLQRLTLDGSLLYSLRDLGTHLRVLQTLSLIEAGVTELVRSDAILLLTPYIYKV
jgi:hypothetical protein